MLATAPVDLDRSARPRPEHDHGSTSRMSMVVTWLMKSPLGAVAQPGARGDLVRVSDGRATIYLLPDEFDERGEEMPRVDRQGQLVAVDLASERVDRGGHQRPDRAERDGACGRQRVHALFQPGATDRVCRRPSSTRHLSIAPRRASGADGIRHPAGDHVDDPVRERDGVIGVALVEAADQRDVDGRADAVGPGRVEEHGEQVAV